MVYTTSHVHNYFNRSHFHPRASSSFYFVSISIILSKYLLSSSVPGRFQSNYLLFFQLVIMLRFFLGCTINDDTEKRFCTMVFYMGIYQRINFTKIIRQLCRSIFECDYCRIAILFPIDYKIIYRQTVLYIWLGL